MQNGRVRFGRTILKLKWVHHSVLHRSALQLSTLTKVCDLGHRWRFVGMLGASFGGCEEAFFCFGVGFLLLVFPWPAQQPQPLHILLLDYTPMRSLLKMFCHGVLRQGLLTLLKYVNLNKPRLFLGPGFVRFRTGMHGGKFLPPVFILLW